MKQKLYRVSLKVHPMVWRYIDNNFQMDNGAYDVTQSMYYPLVLSSICRSNMRLPSRVSDSYEGYRDIMLLITEYDFYHYGYDISPLQQVRYSRILRNIILDLMCRRIVMMRAAFNIPLTRAVGLVVDANLMEPDELKPATLRKIYQRRYMALERETEDFFRDCVTDFGFNDKTFEKKSMCNLSQPIKTPLNLWRI